MDDGTRAHLDAPANQDAKNASVGEPYASLRLVRALAAARGSDAGRGLRTVRRVLSHIDGCRVEKPSERGRSGCCEMSGRFRETQWCAEM
jgi:hypothetical protein